MRGAFVTPTANRPAGIRQAPAAGCERAKPVLVADRKPQAQPAAAVAALAAALVAAAAIPAPAAAAAAVAALERPAAAAAAAAAPAAAVVGEIAAAPALAESAAAADANTAAAATNAGANGDADAAVLLERVERQIVADFVDGQYFVTGNLTKDLYRPDALFSDPTTRVRGVDRYAAAVAALFDPASSRADLLGVEADAGARTVTLRWRLEGRLKLLGGRAIKPYTGARGCALLRSCHWKKEERERE